MGNAVKRKNRRVKKTVRKTFGALLMVTAITVAAIPVPENMAYDPTTEGVPAYTDLSIDDLGTDVLPNSTTHPTSNGTAYTISKPSTGNWQLDWQFEYYSETDGANGFITKYNDQYQVEEVSLNYRVYSDYVNIPEAQISSFYSETASPTTTVDYYYGDSKIGSSEVHSLSYQYVLTGDPTTVGALVHDFYYYNLRSVYDDYKAAYDDWYMYKDTDEAYLHPLPEDVKATYKDVYTTDDAQMQYLCNEMFGSGTSLYIQIVDKRVYESGVAKSWERVYVPRVYTAPVGTDTLTINGKPYFVDANNFLARNFAAIVGIAEGAFKGVSNVKTLEMAREVRYIANEAFENSFLQSITLSQDATIGNRAFKNCNKLSSVTIPTGVSAIGAEAFAGTVIRDIVIPDTVQVIGDGAFYNCGNLGTVTFESGGSQDKTIGDGAFYDCIGLNSVDFGTARINEIGDAAFAVSLVETGNMENFNMPDYLADGDKIGDYLLGNRLKLKYITMPTNLTGTNNVKDNFVAGCQNLECVTFPDNAADAKYDVSTFYGVTNPNFYVRGPKTNTSGSTASCRKSTWIALFDAVKDGATWTGSPVPYVYNEGGMDYFEVCKDVDDDKQADYKMCIDQTGKLVSCTFPSDVSPKLIGRSWDDPFTIPAQVGTITVNTLGDGCFNDVTVRGETEYGVLDYIQYLVIEDGSGINALDPNVFKGAKELLGVDIGDSVISIGDSCFENCPKLEEITIGENIANIGAAAFKNCPSVKEIYFDSPASLDTFTIDNIGTEALSTGGSELTVHGEIGTSYAPFQWSMQSDNYVNTDGLRVCYKTPEPTSLTVIVDNKTNAPTLVDYPHYEQVLRDHPEIKQKITDGTALTNEEKALINNTSDLYIPEGIKSVDVKGFINDRDGNGNAFNDQSVSKYVTKFDYYNQYKKFGLFNGYYGTVDPTTGTDTGSIDDVINNAEYTPSELAKLGVSYEEYDKAAGIDNAIGNDRLASVIMNDVTYLPDKCFENCEKLGLVSLGDDMQDVGSLPFFDCTALTSVACGNGNFVCNNGILYENDTDGSKKIVECLASRGDEVGTSTIDIKNDPDLADVDEIAEGAFSDCDDIRFVNLEGANDLTLIPVDCFRDSDSLKEIDLPKNIEEIAEGAFKDIDYGVTVIARNKNVFLNSEAFDGVNAKNQEYYVTYEDAHSRKTARTKKVNVEQTLDDLFTVRFYMNDGITLLKTDFVEQGKNAEPPADEDMPVIPGYVFAGWNRSYKNITADCFILAVYNPAPDPGPGTPTPTPGPGTPTPKPTQKPSSGTPQPSGGSPQPGPVQNVSPSPTATKYTLTVVYGSGSGQYPAGTKVIIEAIDAPQGKVFDKWVVTGATATVYSTTSKATTVTTAAGDTAITATYKDASSTTPTNTGGNGSSGTYSRTGVGTGTGGGNPTGNNGTRVDITKPGISDTDKAYASVSGSTDSFIVKITESADAANQVATALAAKYGDMTPIKYFAMDISLYDSTGTTKITDTQNLSVNVTIPIPDALRTYAGNNKVGAVVNGNQLEDLPCKFVTVDGVPCVTFTARHFSPYTIYVDTNNLSFGVTDGSPKTGDPIHPKWFVVIALAAGSLFLFLKKDRVVIPKAAQ